ncbi:MAG: purine-nucleoside phosphorylase [Bacteroidota bacterium]|nr:purine-nucleoside phosphorylase [Candidatus Kapabacteria bacterium]MCS7302607.1 purine-nucleoside phosphorylase [Candidatus Kapabacteria bacterium]MDW8074261.1 purine-nucleoside phosphorylase [Bacteroidota bacterium]MDW8271263.1 purine-nucleoside phosphorylase [Bacteroidota bacterium]
MTSHITAFVFDAVACQRSAEYIHHFLPKQPSVAIVAGSGIGTTFDQTACHARIPYRELPLLPTPRIPGHRSELLIVELCGVTAMVFAGRFHVYEGYSPSQVAAPIALLRALGIRKVILTNAAGGLAPELRAGDIVLVSDVVNMTFRSLATAVRERRPLIDEKWRNRTKQSATKAGLPMADGVYVAVHGPSYETPAEVRFYRHLGACIGMSTVHELEAAALCGIEAIVLSVITNTLGEIPSRVPLSHHEVLTTAERSQSMLRRILEVAITSLDPDS